MNHFCDCIFRQRRLRLYNHHNQSLKRRFGAVKITGAVFTNHRRKHLREKFTSDFQETGEFSALLVISPMRSILIDGVTALNARCLYNIGDVTLTLATGRNGAAIEIR